MESFAVVIKKYGNRRLYDTARDRGSRVAPASGHSRRKPQVRRSSRPGKMHPICGPQSAQGKYLVAVENIIDVDPKTAFSDTVLLTEDVAMTGDYTGTLYEKLGPIGPIQLPINGNVMVNSDCSMTSSLNVEGITGPIIIKGVFYNEGRDYYGMAIIDLGNNSPFMYSFAQGKRISQ